MHPVPNDLRRYYEEQYHSIPESLQALERSAEAHERFKIELLQSFKTGGRVIEIGPGTGGFAWLAKRAGFDVTAIEVSARACAFISGTVGVRVIHANDEISALQAEEPADAIVMWQVLEHLANPFGILQAVVKTLRPGGVLIVATPNPEALQFRLLGPRWVHLDAPRHLQLIPASLLSRRAEALGLTEVWTTTRDAGTLLWNRFGWERSLRNLAASRVPVSWTDRAGRLIAWCVAPLERPFPFATSYTTVYKAGGH